MQYTTEWIRPIFIIFDLIFHFCTVSSFHRESWIGENNSCRALIYLDMLAAQLHRIRPSHAQSIQPLYYKLIDACQLVRGHMHAQCSPIHRNHSFEVIPLFLFQRFEWHINVCQLASLWHVEIDDGAARCDVTILCWLLCCVHHVDHHLFVFNQLAIGLIEQGRTDMYVFGEDVLLTSWVVLHAHAFGRCKV